MLFCAFFLLFRTVTHWLFHCCANCSAVTYLISAHSYCVTWYLMFVLMFVLMWTEMKWILRRGVTADQMIISGQVAETEPCLSLACGWWRQEGEKEEPWPWAHLSLHYLPSLKQHTESVETWVQSWEEIWLSVKCLCLWFYEQVRLGFPAHETGHLTIDTAKQHTQRLQYLSMLCQ